MLASECVDEVIVGHDGRKYRCRTVPMIDLNLRNIGRRIAKLDPDTAEALQLRGDQDQLLERRSFLTRPEAA